MAESKCPFCGCKTFYVKDPDDEYETYEFDLKEGEAVFKEGEEGSLECTEDTEAFCNDCAWHVAGSDREKLVGQ